MQFILIILFIVICKQCDISRTTISCKTSSLVQYTIQGDYMYRYKKYKICFWFHSFHLKVMQSKRIRKTPQPTILNISIYKLVWSCNDLAYSYLICFKIDASICDYKTFWVGHILYWKRWETISLSYVFGLI